MSKTVALLAEPVVPAATKSDESGSEDEDNQELSSSSSEASYLEEFKGAVAFLDNGPLLQGMRCAAHTLQLAVHDALKSGAANDIAKKLEARNAVKK